MSTTPTLIDNRRDAFQRWRFRLVIPAAQLLGTSAGVAMGVVSVVFFPLIMGQILWVLSGDALITILPNTDTRWFPSPPAATDTLKVGVNALAMAMGGLYFAHLLTGATQRLSALSGLPAKPVGRNHGAQRYVTNLCQHHRLRRAKVCVVHTPTILAYAASAPFGRSVVVVSDGLLQQANLAMIRWVLAHEVAHLIHGDTRRAAFWYLFVRSLLRLDRLRLTAFNLLLWIASLVPFHGWLLRWWLVPTVRVLNGVCAAVGKFGFAMANTTYKLFDRLSSRVMEYRADHFAAEHEGIAPGIQLFNALDRGFEPYFSFMATHPTLAQRKDALLRLAPVPHAELSKHSIDRKESDRV